MAILNATIKSIVASLAEEKKYRSIKDLLIALNPADVAALFEELPAQTQPLIFRLLPKELAAESFVFMESETQEQLIRGFSDTELKAVVDELYVDDAVDLIEEMPANVVKRILRQASPDMRQTINEVLRYPEDSAGSIMTTEFVELRPSMTCGRAIRHIRNTGIDKETVNNCYVTDEGRHLVGVITIRALILANEDESVGAVMEDSVIAVATTEDRETAVNMFDKYDFTAMPVVDGENRLVGIITVDDALDVLQEEVSEDIDKMAAITPSDKPYLRTSVLELWKNRIPWLLLMMVSATFTGLIITRFEASLAACVTLTAYIPMLMDSGGNSGSQASVTVIRSLSLGQLAFADIFRVLWKELRVSLLCGVTLSAVNFAKLVLFDQVGIAVALVVCITLAVTVVAAKLVGCSLPMLAKRLGLDPAVMASPFITTIVDAISLLLYFSFARMLLGL